MNRTQRRRDDIVARLQGDDAPLTVRQLRAWLNGTGVRVPESTLRLDLLRLTEAGRVERGVGSAQIGRFQATAAHPQHFTDTKEQHP